MTKEIEVKVLNVKLQDMEERLIAAGARLISKEHQINTLLDTKDRYIENTLKSYLRIRETKDLLHGKTKIELTFKKNINQEGARESLEINSQIEDKESIIRILKQLGYEVIDEGYKERTSYKYEDIRYDLDQWDKGTYPHPYMEIEVNKKEDLDRAIELVNISEKQISLKSIMELREEL